MELNELTGAKNVNNNAGNIIYINNNGQCIKVQKDPVTTANIFNNFFINIGKEYSAKFKNKLIDRCNVKCDFSFNEQFLVPIGKDEIKNIINNLKDETASGFDKISVKILKKIENYIAEPLLFILNLCLK